MWRLALSMAAIQLVPLKPDSSLSASPAHLGKRLSVLQEWQVLDGDLPFPAWLANVGVVPI